MRSKSLSQKLVETEGVARELILQEQFERSSKRSDFRLLFRDYGLFLKKKTIIFKTNKSFK